MQLDSTSNVLVSAEKNLLAIDTSYFRASYNSTAQYLSSIKERYFNDTVEENTAIFLSDVYTCSGRIHYLLDSSNSLEGIISVSKRRISDLKHDLEQNVVENNNAKKYVAYELNVAQKTTESIVIAIEKAKLSSIKLDSMKTRIMEIAQN